MALYQHRTFFSKKNSTECLKVGSTRTSKRLFIWTVRPFCTQTLHLVPSLQLPLAQSSTTGISIFSNPSSPILSALTSKGTIAFAVPRLPPPRLRRPSESDQPKVFERNPPAAAPPAARCRDESCFYAPAYHNNKSGSPLPAALVSRRCSFFLFYSSFWRARCTRSAIKPTFVTFSFSFLVLFR